MQYHKREISALMALLLVPLLSWYFEWEFLSLTAEQGWYAKFADRLGHISVWGLFLFTESVSFPYGVLTALVLTLLFAKILKLSLFHTCLLLSILAIVLISGLAVKSLIKHLTSEPRPYMVWLANLSVFVKLDLADYYALNDAVAQQTLLQSVIQQPVFEQWHIPSWLTHHWLKDREYSFPSGHTFFACFFALLSVSLLRKRAGWFSVILLIWAVIVMLSRLFLGMHRPIDLLGGIVIALMAYLLALMLIHQFIPPLRK